MIEEQTKHRKHRKEKGIRLQRRAFARARIREGIDQLRITFVVSTLLYAFFGITDLVVAGPYLSAFLAIRFLAVVPLLIVFIGLTFHPRFPDFAQPLILLCETAAGVGIALMLIVIPDNVVYAGGIFMVISLGYFLSKLEPHVAAIGGFTMLFVYLTGAILWHGTLATSTLLQAVFFLGANLIGWIGSSQMERIAWRNHLHEKAIHGWNVRLQDRVREQHTELVQIEKAIDASSDAVVMYKPEGGVTYRNPAYRQMLAKFPPTGAGVASVDGVGTGAAVDLLDDLLPRVLEDGTWKGERVFRNAARETCVVMIHGDVVQEAHGAVAGIVFTCRDITQRKDAEERMRYLSFHDQLTSLYNRTWFDEELKRLDKTRQLPLSLIMADLNGLKLINDTYGHAAGDRFLKMCADILRQACRGEDIVARWGGDEFVILLPKISHEKARDISERIAHACQSSLFEGIPLSVALGVASKEHPDEPLSSILQLAEDRMYKQKLTESRSHKSAVLSALRNALMEKSFETDTHAGNMQAAAHAIGRCIGLSRDELVKLDLVIRLHDIGKINMPVELLKKNAPLTEEEWGLMKQHPEIGYRIARATEEVSHVAEEILSHHEKWDGTGYPRGLKGLEIPLLARITTLVDAFEVMQNGRPYKEAMTLSEIREEIRHCTGIQFDPELVDVFLEKTDIFTVAAVEKG